MAVVILTTVVDMVEADAITKRHRYLVLLSVIVKHYCKTDFLLFRMDPITFFNFYNWECWFMDDKKIKQIEEKIDSIEKKIDRQGERISKIEQALPREGKSMHQDWQKEPEKLEQKTVGIDAFQQEEFAYKEEKRERQKEGRSEPIDFKKIELNIGKYVFQIVGVVIFLIGMGFLFKYAIEKGVFGPLARVVAGFVAAVSLIVGGEILRKKQWLFGLVAGGIVLCYLSTYAAHTIYALITPMMAFIIFAGTTVLAFVLSLVHHSRTIAYFSLIGGFLTPLFVFGQVELWVDVSYLFFISFAFVIVALLKRWYGLVIGTILFMSYHFGFYSVLDGLRLNYQILNITILYCAVVLVPYLYSLLFSKEDSRLESVAIVMGSFVSFGLYLVYIVRALRIPSVIDASFAPIKWLFAGASNIEVVKYLALIFGTLFLIKTMVMFAKNRFKNRLLSVVATLTILQFFAVIMLHFKEFNLSMAVMGYALLMLGLSFVIKNNYLRIFTYLFIGIGFIIYLGLIWRSIVCGSFSYEFKSLFYNDLNLSTAVLIFIFGVSAYLANKYKSQLDASQKRLPDALTSGIYGTIFAWLMSPLWGWPYRVIALSFYSLSLFFIGAIRSKRYARIYGYFCFIVPVIIFAFHKGMIFYSHLELVDKVHYYYEFNVLCLIFISVLAFFIMVAKFFIKNLLAEEAGTVVGLCELFVSIIASFCLGRNLYLITEGAWFNTAAMSIYYGVAALVFIFIGLLLKRYLIRILGVCVSVLTLWNMWFFVMGMRETASRVIAFIVIGLIFILASFVYQKLNKRV
jgi:hypothetical protein